MERRDYKDFKQRCIQLFPRAKLKNIFPGEWDSIYTGEGIEFADIKPFEPGDDLRDLDLIALVQSGEEEIIQRVAGRQMKVFIWADLSGTMKRREEMFFSSKPEIRDIAIGLLAYSAFDAYSPVGLCAFDNEIRCFLPAKYGEDHCACILEVVIGQDCKGVSAPADIQKAISFLMQRVYKQSMVFFVSDFKNPAFEDDFTDLLRPVAKKVDLIPVVIRDPLEKDATIKRPINIILKDNKGCGSAEVYLTPQKLKEIQEISAGHISYLERNFRRLGIRQVVLDSPSITDCSRVISAFFEVRKRTRI